MKPKRPARISKGMAIEVHRKRLLVATGVGVVALGLAGGVALMSPGKRARAAEPALQIALFTPPPPAIEPGETLDVGELTDGYEHRPPPRPEPIEWVEAEDGWWATSWQDPPPPAWPEREEPETAPTAVVAEPEKTDAMGFGFDTREQAERRLIRSAPPERQIAADGGVSPARVTASGERQALFY